MQIEILNKIGNAIGIKAPVKNYRKNPGDFNAAAEAAFYYAKRNKKNMVIIPGNSYGAKVFHIALESDDLKKYTIVANKASVAYVKVNGETFQAIAKT